VGYEEEPMEADREGPREVLLPGASSETGNRNA